MNTVTEKHKLSSEINIEMSKKDITKEARDLCFDARECIEEIVNYFLTEVETSVEACPLYGSASENTFRLKALIYMIEDRLSYLQPAEFGIGERCVNCITKMTDDWWDKNCPCDEHTGKVDKEKTGIVRLLH